MSNPAPARHLLCIGAGYTARHLAQHIQDTGWTISGTTREADKAGDLASLGIRPVIWTEPLVLPLSILENATDLIISTAPQPGLGCPALAGLQPFLERFDRLQTVLYYSSTGVYADAGGAWIDETFPLLPQTDRGKRRVAAEAAWQKTAAALGLSTYIFRLSGIYGPGRNAMETLLKQRTLPVGSPDNPSGTGRRVHKPGQYFNRIHVEDIAGATLQLLKRHASGNPPEEHIFNLADDLPSPPEDVISHAAKLLNLEEPPLISIEDADLSPMGRSFYADSKRLHNDRLQETLGYTLRYPTYREGLSALLPTVNHSKE
jgi:nucleoside-diphosphate-sugar epimerase